MTNKLWVGVVKEILDSYNDLLSTSTKKQNIIPFEFQARFDQEDPQ